MYRIVVEVDSQMETKIGISDTKVDSMDKALSSSLTFQNADEDEDQTVVLEPTDGNSKEFRIKFFSGNPAIEITEGIIHLYRSAISTSSASSPAKMQTNMNNNLIPQLKLPETRSALLCVLAVPGYMSPADISNFVAPYHKEIHNMRILRSSTSKLRHMVIMKMATQESADCFWEEFNGKPFNSMAPETCAILFVSDVEFLKPTKDGILFPPSGQMELPTCPVCLERLEESVGGILTILCNHSFHCQCLSKWKGESTCPVCRYSHAPEEQGPVCSICKTSEQVWICLICGNVGCGRYKNEHARLHFKESNHAYSLELQTGRVWDYVGDKYVHRLLQNMNDGKVIEFASPEKIAAAEMGIDIPDMSKMDAIALEYGYVLEAQRNFYEEQLKKIELQKSKKISLLEQEYAELLERQLGNEKRIYEMEEERKKGEKKSSQFGKESEGNNSRVFFLETVE